MCYETLYVNLKYPHEDNSILTRIPTEFNGIFDDSVTLWVLKNSAEMLPSALSRTLLEDTFVVVLLSSRKPATVPATTIDNHADGWFPPMLDNHQTSTYHVR